MPTELLLETTLAAIEGILNAILRRGAPATRDELAALCGHAVEIVLSDLDLHLFVLFGRHGISLSRHRPSTVSTTLSGTTLALCRLGSQGSDMPVAVQIEGDVELGQRLRKLVEKLDIDWEEILASACGDSVAHALMEQLRRARRQADSARERLAEDLADYLLEEARLVPRKEEIETFVEEVDELRAAVDRCCARFDHLERRLEAGRR